MQLAAGGSFRFKIFKELFLGKYLMALFKVEFKLGIFCIGLCFGLLVLMFVGFSSSADAAGRQQLHGHIPKEVSQAPLVSEMPPSEKISLAIGLPLRNQQALQSMLQRLYDPKSPIYGHFLTPAKFAEMFGPTIDDYQALIDFAKSNGLSITGTHSNRTLVEVSGTVGDIEKTFNVKLNYYHRPDGSRFHAPDIEPSVDFNVSLLHVAGLENYARPQLALKVNQDITKKIKPLIGSGSDTGYFGNDFRNAYVPCTSLTGSGQNVASLQLEGFYQNDISNYENQAGISNNVPIAVLCDGATGVPDGNLNFMVETSLDIEMQVSMAPAASIYVYEGPVTPAGWESVFATLAAPPSGAPLVGQISSSWLYFLDDNISNALIEMAAQGQSFFQASGDDDSYSSDPGDNRDGPYITLVGGTQLSMNGIGASYASETTWNQGIIEGKYVGSGGGILTSLQIPNYQTNIPMTSNYG
ncbi:MAG TPA: protease pro-enzyme activation domain-containing protein, partial [bacterium]|nr:protease pro-enzyme activation domain-containing protein [bacterium]